MKQITGKHVAAMFGLGFGTIIAVNLTLAVHAVRSFPGLEVGNSYVASQSFQADRRAQEALDWEVSAHLSGGVLSLRFARDGHPIAPQIESAVLGRATSVAADQHPVFRHDGNAFTAPVDAGAGYWNLRIVARAEDGTRFQQRLRLEARP